ncbi:MAG: hypothetical protein H0T89_00735 [Deltaproteobacteria bacterium]|nr:hypothetical protein [Deltaproteobacteria bacterium]
MTGAEVARAKATQKLALVPPDTDEMGTAVDEIDENGNQIEIEAGETIEPGLGPASADSEPAGPAAPIVRADPLITVGQAIESLVKLSALPVYPTPFPTVNDAIGFGGFKAGQKYDAAAGTGRGKTSFVTCIGTHHAAHGDTLIATYEMAPAYYVARAASGALGVHSNAIVRGEVPARDVLRALPQRLVFLHRPTLAILCAQAKRIADKTGRAPLVIVDYMQKLAEQIMAGQPRADARLATSEASAGLIDLADETGAVVLAVSATSRANGKRTADPRKLAPYDLVDVAKDSGSVEYDSAGLIVLSLGEEYEGDERHATITVAKARFGQECHIEARFNGPRGTWRDLGRIISGDRGKSALKQPLPDAIREALRMPAASRTELATRVRRGKGATLAAIGQMIEAGEIGETDGRLEILRVE